MTRIITLVLLFAASLHAQTYTITPIGSTDKLGQTETDISFEVQVINTTNRSQEAWIIKNALRLPAGWESTICVGGFCYEPDKDSVTLTLTANKTDTVKFNIIPTTTLDSARFDLRIESKLNAADGGNTIFIGRTIAQVNREKLAQVQMLTFPNPVQDQLFIKTEGFQTSAQVEITDLTGRVCLTTVWNSTNNGIAVGHLQPGLYIIRLKNDSNQASYTFVKE